MSYQNNIFGLVRIEVFRTPKILTAGVQTSELCISDDVKVILIQVFWWQKMLSHNVSKCQDE